LTPSQAFEWFLVGWLTALALLVLYRVLSGRIALVGLLTMDGQRHSPERLQLLLFTLGALAIYIGQALVTGQSATIKSLPEVPDWVLPLLLGSHALYLGGRIAGR